MNRKSGRKHEIKFEKREDRDGGKRIGFEIKTLSHMIRRRMDGCMAAQAMNDMTGTHGWVIGYLAAHEGQEVYQRDLEKIFSVRRSTATNILQLMEKNGLITREPVARDARLKKLTLTPKAIALNDDFRREVDNVEAEMTDGISPEEIDSFYAVIKKMRTNLENKTEAV